MCGFFLQEKKTEFYSLPTLMVIVFKHNFCPQTFPLTPYSLILHLTVTGGFF